MQHYTRSGKLEVDHFDPRLKSELIQDFENLFPATRHVNGMKSDTWPTKAEQAAGCRFLNPCKEVDYGQQIFEDPHTHELLGINPAARWHIRICGLNAEPLVVERRRRAQHLEALNNAIVRVKSNQPLQCQEILDLIMKYREEVEAMIPSIAPPPAKYDGAAAVRPS
jgi:hypothetical protein